MPSTGLNFVALPRQFRVHKCESFLNGTMGNWSINNITFYSPKSTYFQISARKCSSVPPGMGQRKRKTAHIIGYIRTPASRIFSGSQMSQLETETSVSTWDRAANGMMHCVPLVNFGSYVKNLRRLPSSSSENIFIFKDSCLATGSEFHWNTHHHSLFTLYISYLLLFIWLIIK